MTARRSSTEGLRRTCNRDGAEVAPFAVIVCLQFEKKLELLSFYQNIILTLVPKDSMVMLLEDKKEGRQEEELELQASSQTPRSSQDSGIA